MTTHINELNALREDLAHLQREVTMYRSIFAQLPIGTYVYQLEHRDDDRTLRMVTANAVVEQLAGLPPDAIVGKTLDESFPGLRDQGLPQAFAQVVRTGEPFEVESVYGDDRVIENAFAVRAVALPDDCVAVMFENLTARRQAEHALKLANEELEQRMAERTEQLRYHQTLLQHVLDTSPAAIYVKDLHGQFVLVNQRTSALLGLTPDEMQGKYDTDLFPADFAAQWRDNEQRVMAAGVPTSIEETVMQEDGLHTFLSTRTPMYDETGAPYAIGGIAYDITERKQQEDELHMFRALVENAPSMISVADIDGRYRYFNPTFRERMGIALEAPPENFQIVDMSPADMADDLRHTLIPQIIEQGVWKGRSVFRCQDGSTFPGDLAVFVTRDAHGTPKQFIALANDVSEQVAAEHEREALQQQVLEAQRTALRELSTPLIPITDEVVIMPLIGTIDSQRAQQVMETLLDGVAQHRATLVILDITGVSVVDTQVAQAFIQAAQAVKLLGAQVMLTGIQPQIAQTLVMLGADLSSIQTRGSLQAGIVAALQGT
jgi:anti-anti-sigma factor